MIAGLGTFLMTFASAPQLRKLPSLPHAIAGQFVGAIDNTVVVAGGSWWTSPPDEGGVKMWDDRIQVLQQDSKSWQSIGQLPQPMAYGGALSLGHELVLAGGQNEDMVSSKVWSLKLNGRRFNLSSWPDLPNPLTNFSIAFAGNKIYVFGGQKEKNSLASASLWSLTIQPNGIPAAAWQQESPLPGKGRILAAAAGCGGRLYVVGGATLEKLPDGIAARHYLREAWSYDPVNKWIRLPDPPTPSVAAPAVCAGGHSVLLIGGDDGHMDGVVLRPGEVHPGFSKVLTRYDAINKTWSEVGKLPLGLVTTGAAVLSDGRIVIPGGEDRPGSRSNVVLELSPSTKRRIIE